MMITLCDLRRIGELLNKLDDNKGVDADRSPLWIVSDWSDSSEELQTRKRDRNAVATLRCCF